MDLLIMLLFAVVLTIIGLPYITDGTYADEQSVASTVINSSTFVAADLPYCGTGLCKRQKCFTYYQEVLGLWR